MYSPKTNRQIEILLVDHYPTDVYLFRHYLADGPLRHRFSVARSRGEAAAILDQERAPAAVLLPDLIILNLDLPEGDGWRLLEEIKTDSRLTGIPVMVLTNSARPTDVERAYELRANYYLTRPSRSADIPGMVGQIEEFWLASGTPASERLTIN